MKITGDLVTKYNLIRTFELEQLKLKSGFTVVSDVMERCHEQYIILMNKKIILDKLREITG